METAFYIVLLEPGFVKNRVIREKINGGSGLSGLPLHRKQSIFQRNNGISPLISVLIDKTAGPYRDTEPGRQRVYHGGTHPVKTSAGFVGAVVKFSARMKSGKNQTFCADSLFMHSHGNATAIVRHSGGTIRLQSHRNGITEAGQMFVHGVIYNLINQVVQSFGRYTADVHAGTFPHRLQTFQHCDAGGVIVVCICH